MPLSEGDAQVVTIPACTGGWNTNDNITPYNPDTGIGMGQHYALTLKNWFPEESATSLRRGYREHSTGGMGGAVVKTLAEFSGANGTRKLIAAANGKIYNASAFGVNATQLATGFTSDLWQTVNYKDRLILVNGVDRPQQIDSTPTVSAANYTGIADAAVFVNVSVFRDRLYFVPKDSQSIWHMSSVGTITGAVTEFSFGDYLAKGGYPIFGGPVTQNLGSSLTSLFAIVTSMGEVLIYSGTYPGGSWSLSARLVIGEPLGRRACFYKGGDLVVITEEGLIPIVNALSSDPRESDELATLSQNIRPTFLESARLYGDETGWQGCVYPRGRWLIVNIPIATNTNHQQFVMNSRTGAWCEFTGMNAACWGLFNKKVYFGGTDGKIYEADYGATDNGAAIETEKKWAYNYCGDSKRIKHFTKARPMLNATGNINFLFDVDVDFQNKVISGSVSVVGSGGTPWGSPWGSPWSHTTQYVDDWRDLASGVGRCAALRLKGSFTDVTATLAAVDLMFTPGGKH